MRPECKLLEFSEADIDAEWSTAFPPESSTEVKVVPSVSEFSPEEAPTRRHMLTPEEKAKLFDDVMRDG